MKKVFVGLLFMTLFSSLIAQEAGDKKVQGGLVFGAGINMLKPGTKYITSNGVGSDLTVGMNLNYSFSPSIAFSTGLEFDFESIRTKAGSTQLYYYFNDTEIYNKGKYLNGDGVYSPTGTLFKMSERKEKPIYLTIPTMLMFRTKFIGYFRYFGKFGLRNSFLLSSEINDKGFIDGVESDNLKVRSSVRDLSIYKGFVGITGGAEWNFSGSTCLVAELGYYYGFVDVNRGKALTGDDEKNMTIFNGVDGVYTSGSIPSGFSTLPFRQNQLLLKLSILF